MWPGFGSRTWRHMWVEFVAGSRLCSERVFSGYPGFTLSSKTKISKFQFDIDAAVDEDPSFGYATANSTLIPIYFIYFYLFIYINDNSNNDKNTDRSAHKKLKTEKGV